MNKRLSNHIQSGGIQIKKKNLSGGEIKPKLSPMSLNYKLYLQNGGKPKSEIKTQHKNEGKKITIKRKSPKKEMNSIKEKDPTIRIIHQKENKSKHKFTRKKPSNVKDINEIEKQIEFKKRETKEIKKSLVKEIQKKISKPTPKSKGVIRKNKRNSKRNSNKNSKGSRKVSMKKHKKISEKDIHKVQKHIEEIRSKKTEDIKLELEKEGIKVSGKSKRLLKDIYLYSKVCGINIQHEK
jgi:hypothetical protein